MIILKSKSHRRANVHKTGNFSIYVHKMGNCVHKTGNFYQKLFWKDFTNTSTHKMKNKLYVV